MAASTFVMILAIIFFSIRGFFLGLPGVVARLFGLACAFFITFNYSDTLADRIATHIASTVPLVVWQLMISATLFFVTVSMVSLIILGSFRFLSRAVPWLAVVFTEGATGSRIAGSVINGAIGAVIVLIVLWLYGITLGINQKPDHLQGFANQFGDSLLAICCRWSNDEKSYSLFSRLTQHKLRGHHSQVVHRMAEIQSTKNPDRRIVIEQDETTVQTGSGDKNIDLSTLLNNPQFQQLTSDPEVRKQVMDYLKSHPDDIKNALHNPRIRKLLEQLKSQ